MIISRPRSSGGGSRRHRRRRSSSGGIRRRSRRITPAGMNEHKHRTCRGSRSLSLQPTPNSSFHRSGVTVFVPKNGQCSAQVRNWHIKNTNDEDTHRATRMLVQCHLNKQAAKKHNDCKQDGTSVKHVPWALAFCICVVHSIGAFLAIKRLSCWLVAGWGG